MKLQHLALKTNGFEQTYTFYTDILGCSDARYEAVVGRIWLDFADGFTLIFDRADEPLNPQTVQYLGLELPSFAAVDEMYQQVASHAELGRDMRELYREAKGPYGFFICDPNGYRIKVFCYNEGSSPH